MRVNKRYTSMLQFLLIPFAVATWGSVIVLGLLRWCLFLGKYPMLQVDEEIWNFWIPVIFPWIPILLWLKPRFKAIVFTKYQEQRSWNLQIIAWITMAATGIFSQHYLITSTGKLLELANVKEIAKHDKVRYYRLDSFAVHKPIGGVSYAFRTSGKLNANLDIYIYFVNPMLTHKNQHIVTTPLYWYGVKFNKRISNLGTIAKKERRFKAFFQECLDQMNKNDVGKPDHFENKPASYDRKNFRRAVQSALRTPVNDDFVILEPRSAAAEQRNGHKIAWAVGCFLSGAAVFMLVLIRVRLKDPEEEEVVKIV